MAISSVGIGSGLDATSIINQLVELEKTPLKRLQTQASDMSNQLSALGQIKGKIAALQDAAATLAKPTLWTRTAGLTTDSSAVTVTTSDNAASGDFSVSIGKLAKAQSLASGTFAASSTVVGGGKLRIELGTWSNLGTATAAFAAKNGTSPIDVEIPANATLDTIRNKINDAKAGVTASIVNDAGGARLVIRSDKTGAENALRITEVDDAGAAVAGGALGNALGYDPVGGAATPMTQTVPAQNAQATINGLPLVSSSNTFSNVSDGMSFTALKETTTDVTLKVDTDAAGFKAALSKFTAAYNDLNTTIRNLTKYDDATQTGAILQGDSTAVSLQNQLRSLVQGKGGTSTVYTRLSDLGIAMQRDGTLSIDDAKLSKALADPDEVAKALSSSADALPANRGIAALFQSFASVVTGTDGPLTTRTNSLSSRLKRNGTDQDRANDRIEETRTRLQKQYTALDTKMASLTGLNNYISQQITNWNKSR
jgi:flagellar hook-associated protein 2